MKRLTWLACSVFSISMFYSLYYAYELKKDNQFLSQINKICDIQNKLLKEEIGALDRGKNSYEQGVRDTIIRMSGPQMPGYYLDGWNAALFTIEHKSYADGYHTAIEQFGYQKPQNVNWLVAKPESEGSYPSNKSIEVKFQENPSDSFATKAE